MAHEALVEHYRTLKFKPGREMITTEEHDALESLALGIIDRALVCASFAGGFAWRAARRLKEFDRFAVTGGIAGLAIFTYVHWPGRKTTISFFDHILGQDATRMRKELVNVLIRDNQGEAWRLKLMSKHLYQESVYNDDKAEKPQMRWRRRNIFTDAIFTSHDIDETKLFSSYGGSLCTPDRSAPDHAYVTRIKPKVQCSSGNSAGDMGEDPFDCVFGVSETPENIQTADNSAGSSRALTRKERRAQRRRNIRNREASLGTPQYEHT